VIQFLYFSIPLFNREGFGWSIVYGITTEFPLGDLSILPLINALLWGDEYSDLEDLITHIVLLSGIYPISCRLPTELSYIEGWAAYVGERRNSGSQNGVTICF